MNGTKETKIEKRRQRTSKDKKAKRGRNSEDNGEETEPEGRQRRSLANARAASVPAP